MISCYTFIILLLYSQSTLSIFPLYFCYNSEENSENFWRILRIAFRIPDIYKSTLNFAVSRTNLHQTRTSGKMSRIYLSILQSTSSIFLVCNSEINSENPQIILRTLSGILYRQMLWQTFIVKHIARAITPVIITKIIIFPFWRNIFKSLIFHYRKSTYPGQSIHRDFNITIFWISIFDYLRIYEYDPYCNIARYLNIPCQYLNMLGRYLNIRTLYSNIRQPFL